MIDKNIPLPTEGPSFSAAAAATFGDNPFKPDMNTMSAVASPVAPVRGARRMSKGEAWTSARRKEQEANFLYSGVSRPAVVVNLNPFPLTVNGGMLFNTAIPACGDNDPYVSVVLDRTKWDYQDQGVGLDNIEHYYPIPCHPAQQATEYIREYTLEQNRGGVIVFMGTRVPDDIDINVDIPIARSPEDQDATMRIEFIKRNLKEVWQAAESRRNEAIISRLQKATGNYERDETRNLVNDNDRADARLARKIGLIPELPRWCLVSNLILGETLPDPCPACGAVPTKGAAICKSCNAYVFDIVKAYKASAIEYGHVSMDRATEEEWELILDEKNRRDKIRAKFAKRHKLPAANGEAEQ
jgi:hypothetical protein